MTIVPVKSSSKTIYEQKKIGNIAVFLGDYVYFCSASKILCKINNFINIKTQKKREPKEMAKKFMEYDLLTRRDGYYGISDPLLALWLKSRKL